MIEKKFKHNKIEKCRISLKDINTEKEQYAIIVDCDKDKIMKVGFYKLDLLRDLIKGNGKLIEMSFLERQREIINKLLGGNPMLKKLMETKLQENYIIE